MMVEVQSGDVLLFKGKGFISRAIRFLDGSEVNHAAIALNASELSEALAQGLVRGSILGAVERNDVMIVRRPIGGDSAQAASRAEYYLAAGVPYAYQQILLLAILCVTRRAPIKNRLFRRLVRRALDAAADLLNAFVDDGTDLMICSEYVYRCHKDAGFDLLPEGIPGLDAAAAADSDEEVLLDWLAVQSVSAAPMAAAAGAVRAEPATIASVAEYELEELAGAFFAGEEPGGVAPLTAEEAEWVSDEELVAAADRFAQAAGNLVELRASSEAGPATAVTVAQGVDLIRGMFVTNPDFVTPRDLLFSAQLTNEGRVD